MIQEKRCYHERDILHNELQNTSCLPNLFFQWISYYIYFWVYLNTSKYWRCIKYNWKMHMLMTGLRFLKMCGCKLYYYLYPKRLSCAVNLISTFVYGTFKTLYSYLLTQVAWYPCSLIFAQRCNYAAIDYPAIYIQKTDSRALHASKKSLSTFALLNLK